MGALPFQDAKWSRVGEPGDVVRQLADLTLVLQVRP
jgi:hypothetical protein